MKNAFNHHKDLPVWQKSVALAGKVYLATRRFPAAEQAGLSPEMRRAALMVASHVADGAGRCARGEYIRFLGLARSSLAELGTQVHIAGSLQLIEAGLGLEGDVAEVGRMLAALIRKLREERVPGVNIKS